jgi:predicted nucleotidyltransferase
VEERLAQVPVVRQLAAAVNDMVIGLYVGGSVATGDYRPGVSDVDVVALVDRTPDPGVRAAIVEVHRGLIAEAPDAAAVHCVYVCHWMTPARRRASTGPGPSGSCSAAH